MGLNPVSSITSSLLTLSVGGAAGPSCSSTVSAPSQPAAPTSTADSANLDSSQLADEQIQIVLQNRQADLQRTALLTLLKGLSPSNYQNGKTRFQPTTVDVHA